jgi:hypothetical protein
MMSRMPHSKGLGYRTVLAVLLLHAVLQAQGNRGVVTGQIRLPDGSPAVGIRVSAMRANGGMTDAGIFLESLAETDAAGRYRLSGITPGRYYIVAGALDAPTYFPGAASIKDARILEITDGSAVASVDFTVQHLRAAPQTFVAQTFVMPRGIAGSVVMDGGGPLPLFLPRLYVDLGKRNSRTEMGAEGNRVRGTGTYGAIAVSPEGNFGMLLEDGDYDVFLITSLGEPIDAAGAYYVKSIVSGSVDLSRQKLQVRGRTAPDITITLAPRR